MNKQKGVTLIELLIVIAVIGILTAISYPYYQQYILEGYRSQAMADMIKVQLTLEHSYSQKGRYDFSVISNGRCSFCETAPNRYRLLIDSSGAGMDNYKISAVPQSATGQDADICGTLTLNAAGVGTASGNENCW